jgi:cytochrome c
VPEDFTLDARTLFEVKMPNRNGFTRTHGMGSVRGRPDVQGSACMKDCAVDVSVSSMLLEFARNQHGNLAEQHRALGGLRGIDTLAYDPSKPVPTRVAAAPAVAEPKDLLTRNACTACHATNNRVVGPAFIEVAEKYRSRSDAIEVLTRKIRSGGTGTWGPASMPPQPALKDDELATLARWILSVAK